MFNFKSKFEDVEPEIRESVDRKNRQPKGELPVDEDEELVNQNDPKNNFIRAEDVPDDYDFSDDISLEDDNLENKEEAEDASEPNEEEFNNTIEPAKIFEEELIEEMINDKDIKFEEKSGTDKNNLDEYKDYGVNSRKMKRQTTGNGQSHYGDNRKTMSDSKKARDKREVTREFLGK